MEKLSFKIYIKENKEVNGVFRKLRKLFLLFLTLFLVTSCANGTKKTDNNETETPNKIEKPKEVVEVNSKNECEQFALLNTSVAGGLFFDKEGNMLVGKPSSLEKVSVAGEVTTFCDLNEPGKKRNYFFNSPFIWDMKYDKDNNIIAAAQDRILKIDPEGKVTTLIRENFNGFLGASGLELDEEGNIYVVSGSKVYKYSKNLEKTEYLSSDQYKTFFSIAFSPDKKYLYLTDFNTKSLIKYEIKKDGTVGKHQEIVRDPVKDSGSFGAPLNIIFSDSGNMYVSIDGMSRILKIDKDENLYLIKMDKTIRNHVIQFGTKEFGEDYIYITTYSNTVYRMKLDDK